MKSKFNDRDVLELLTGLKNTENKYASDLLASRRDQYIKQAAAMAVLMKTQNNGANSGGSGPSSTSSLAAFTMPSIGKILEIGLATAIIVEAGVIAYFYRDQIKSIINDLVSPRVEQVINTPDASNVLPVVGTSTKENEQVTETSTPIVIVTVTMETPAPLVAPDGNTDDGNATATPKDNPGNHYGNTPKPERTKDKQPNNDKSDNKDKKK